MCLKRHYIRDKRKVEVDEDGERNGFKEDHLQLGEARCFSYDHEIPTRNAESPRAACT